MVIQQRKNLKNSRRTMQEQHDERCRVIFRFVFKCFKCLCEQSFFRFNVDPVCEDLWLIYKINLQMLKTD